MDKKLAVQHLLPIIVEVQEGKTYSWCSCGQSNTQPFCDKKNCGDCAKPFKADLTEAVCLCVCKQTKNPPWCDGSHAALLLDYIRNHGGA